MLNINVIKKSTSVKAISIIIINIILRIKSLLIEIISIISNCLQSETEYSSHEYSNN